MRQTSELRTTRQARGVALALVSILMLMLLAACQPIQSETFADEAAAAAVAPADVAPTEAVAEPASDATDVPADAPADVPAEDATTIAGDWEGVVRISTLVLRILVNFEEESGAWTGTIAIPQQGATDLPLHTITVDDAAVHFEMLEGPALGVFVGELDAEGAIAGTFAQGGAEGTFSLTSAVAVEADPVPYVEEEVTFTNGDVTLAGTLTLPEGDGPFPAVLLVTGSGPQNRNEELSIVLNYQPFREIADRLTQEGVAVLRYDDRGVGESTGDFASATTSDFAADAQAGLDYLRARTEIDAAQVGVLGHSEGSLVAAMLGASDPELAFIISWAGPGVSGYDVVIEQVGKIASASGVDEATVEEMQTMQRGLLDLVIAEDRAALEAELIAVLNEQFDTLDAPTQEALGGKEVAVAEQTQIQMDALLSDWYRAFIAYDPTSDWEQVDVPVLLLFGGLDTQVTLEQNMQPLVAALEAGGNNQVTVEVLPEANHLFQQAVTGSVDEYGTLDPALMAEFLDIVVRWLNQTVSYVQ